MKTAVQELLIWLEKMPKVPMSRDLLVSKLLIAESKEKNQICEAYDDAYFESTKLPSLNFGEDYYNQTYKK